MNRFAESEYGTEIHRQSLDAAIPPPDILANDDDSDVTDMVVDIPTAADTVATMSATSSVVASPVIDSQPGLRLPSFDLADTARQGSLDAIYDQSGAEVTPKRLLAAIKPLVFIDLDLLRDTYYETHHCQLIPNGIKPHEFVKALSKLDGFGYLTLWLSSEHSAGLSGLTLLKHDSCDPVVLCRSLLNRLGLAQDTSTVVIGPVLCYSLVILCGTHMDQMTGQLLEQVFAVATGVELHSLWTVTKRGTRQMSAIEHCHMVKFWVNSLVEFITKNDIGHALDMVAQCNGEYARRRGADGNNSKDTVAVDMLRHNELFSQLFLGLHKADLRALYKVLPLLMGSDTST
ncbi:hypothetical protein FBU31_003090 [Coemansia sp. 'formosensis']|nr:hypothetical protein FBU31_003090 [Coemansia sp. 'formosensis']